MKPIKLLYFTSEPFPTFRADVAALFGQHLPRQGVNSDIVTIKGQPAEGEQWPAGKAILAARSGRGIKGHLIKVVHIIKTAISASTSEYDAFQLRDMPFLGLLVLCIARLRGVPFFYWCSYPIPEGQIMRANETLRQVSYLKYLAVLIRGQLGRWLVYRVVMPKSTHVFVQSRQMQADFCAQGVPLDKMTPVPMGVDVAALNALQNKPLPDFGQKGKRVLIYLGTMERPRQIHVLFETLAIVRKQVPNVVLVLVGGTRDAAHRKWLQEQAEHWKVEDLLYWTGWIPMDEAWSYVRAADVGYSPFPRGYLLDSASPTKVPEYLAMGVPVVCNDNPDQAAVVAKSKAGICVDYTAEQFAAATLELLVESAEARQQRIEQGINLIESERDYAVLAADLAASYHSLLSAKKV